MVNDIFLLFDTFVALKGAGGAVLELELSLLKLHAVSINDPLYTAAERAADPQNLVLIHRLPFIGDFCLQRLDIQVGHALNLLLHMPPDAVVQRVEVRR